VPTAEDIFLSFSFSVNRLNQFFVSLFEVIALRTVPLNSFAFASGFIFKFFEIALYIYLY